MNGSNNKVLSPPLTDQQLQGLSSGDQVLITGRIYTARDAAHQRLIDHLDQNGCLPIELSGQIIYYVGPTPTKPGHVIGSSGPTTSGRMDKYTPSLLEEGVKGFIGKGSRSEQVVNSLTEHNGIYMAAVGGAAALLKQKIVSSQIILYEDLGPEAIRKLEVKDFPVTVVNDIYGNDLYQQGRQQFRK